MAVTKRPAGENPNRVCLSLSRSVDGIHAVRTRARLPPPPDLQLSRTCVRRAQKCARSRHETIWQLVPDVSRRASPRPRPEIHTPTARASAISSTRTRARRETVIIIISVYMYVCMALKRPPKVCHLALVLNKQQSTQLPTLLFTHPVTECHFGRESSQSVAAARLPLRLPNGMNRIARYTRTSLYLCVSPVSAMAHSIWVVRKCRIRILPKTRVRSAKPAANPAPVRLNVLHSGLCGLGPPGYVNVAHILCTRLTGRNTLRHTPTCKQPRTPTPEVRCQPE